MTRALVTARDLSLEDAEVHVHDVMNVFMCTGYTRDTHQYFMKASPVRPGDFIEFFAEIDCPASAHMRHKGRVEEGRISGPS